MVSATSAEWITILEGMQPRLRQVPPMALSSMIATFNPSSAAPAATFNPAPEPMTIKSKVFMVYLFGRISFQGIVCLMVCLCTSPQELHSLILPTSHLHLDLGSLGEVEF